MLKTVKQAGIVNLSLILACAVLITASRAFANTNAEVQQQPANDSTASASQQATVAIYRFALRSETVDTTAPASQVCSQFTADADPAAGSNAQDNVTIDPKILDAISTELQQALSKKKMTVMADPDPGAIPVGSSVVCGRVFRVQKGSRAGRMIGLGFGASRLYAHVVLLSKTESGFASFDSFDLKLKGRNLTPPGASTAVLQVAIMEKRQNLSGLSKKLANQVAKRLDGNLKKRPELAAKDVPHPAKEVSR